MAFTLNSHLTLPLVILVRRLYLLHTLFILNLRQFCTLKTVVVLDSGINLFVGTRYQKQSHWN